MEIHVSGNNSVFDINHDDIINEIPIVIHNDQYNPAARVFLNLPKTNSKILKTTQKFIQQLQI